MSLRNRIEHKISYLEGKKASCYANEIEEEIICTRIIEVLNELLKEGVKNEL